MAAGTTPIFTDSVETAVQDIVAADTTTPQTLVTAGADGARVYSVSIATDDTAAIEYSLYLQRDGAGTNFLLGTKSVPAASGNAAASPAVDLLDSAYIKLLDADGTLILGGTDVLKVAARTTVTAAKTTYVTATYGDY